MSLKVNLRVKIVMFFVFGLLFSGTAQIDLDSLMHERDKSNEYPIDKIRNGAYTLLKRPPADYLDSNWVIRWRDQSWYIDSIFSKETPFLVDVTQVSLFEAASQDTSMGIIGLSFEVQWNLETPKENWEEHRKLKVILEPQSRRELFRATYFYTQDHYDKLLYDELSGKLYSTFTYYYYDLHFNGYGDAFISNVKDTCVFKLDEVSGRNRKNISSASFSVDSVIDHKPGKYENIHGHYVYSELKKEKPTSYRKKELFAESTDKKVKIYNVYTKEYSDYKEYTVLEYDGTEGKVEWYIDSLIDLTYHVDIYNFSVQHLQFEEGGMPEVLLTYTKKIVGGDDFEKITLRDSIHILLSLERREELFRAVPKMLHKVELYRGNQNSSKPSPRKPWQFSYEYNITYENQRLIIDELEVDSKENEKVVDHKPGIYILQEGKIMKQ